MLTNIHIRNFKKLRDVCIELGQAVVFIGPNNSGKTAALQALALWDIGRRKWTEKRGSSAPEKRPGVTINRTDLVSIPVPAANLLWRDLHVRDVNRVDGKQRTSNILIDVIVDGVTGDRKWSCGLEFDYANEESFYCRPLRLSEGKPPTRMGIPSEANDVAVAYLPPMSGLADREYLKQPGEIGFLIGQGQTAQVLRNLCYQIYSRAKGLKSPNGTLARDRPRKSVRDLAGVDAWDCLVEHIQSHFGVTLLPPEYVPETSLITMAYRQGRIALDLSSSGRGLQQTLLLLAHLYANPGTVLLLDEPDAHLEVLRQREMYQLLTEVAASQGSQVVAASHSEVVLRDAADRDLVIAFLGSSPHRVNDRGSQLQKSLKEIGFEDYYLAEQNGWVLYLEGSTDLAILQAFARTLNHPAQSCLERPFVHYVGNQNSQARKHFNALKEAHQDLVGIALFDRDDFALATDGSLRELMWKQRELENYLCQEDVLLAYTRGEVKRDLFSPAEADHREEVMRSCIDGMVKSLETSRKPSPWGSDLKVSDDFLDPLFANYFDKLDLPNQMRKTNFHVLASLVAAADIDPEVKDKLDAIAEVAEQSRPVTEE